ncbi:hypothetical protein Ais01nite_16660 [Asanoa ishikariensis]|uniref:Uncharacterized protein n=1 Tax=Asanoa ishikariensis TaxID=137265 RepID=A0A1H3UFK0_9ACTN|nr:hypothetical protein [Asanoa ishikariensis]GIF63631.1 hypothetical protein Ais01nite_16660 [Asanoa ishikariensis]SDZ61213.1 hypothetical protein SAMN05421684_7207 [Asanoa ishikariensis]
MHTAPSRGYDDEPLLFDHSAPPEQPAGPLNAITRYLCGASYVDPGFGDRVVGELTEDAHRAVVPPTGYDLGPVLRHAYRARRIWLTQHALVTLVLLAGLFLAPVGTILLVGAGLALALPALIGGRIGRAKSRRVAVVAVAVLLALALFGVPIVMAINSLVDSFDSSGDSYDYGGGYGGYDESTEPSGAGLWFLGMGLVGVAAFLVVLVCKGQAVRVLATELAPGAPVGRHGTGVGGPAGQRVQAVAAAQHGNIVLHSGYNPFLGAGRVTDAWSVAVELKPARPLDGLLAPRRPPDEPAPPPVAIDPVALNRHVKERVAALSSPDLPEGAAFTSLQLRDQIIADGTRWRDFPLVDQALRVPYSVATRDAMDEIVRHPQSSARHFLRVSVGAESRAIRRPDRTVVMPAEHQSVMVTTFTHIAVEGGMLYVENVAAMLGPIRRKYLDIDHFPRSADVWWEALKESLRSAGADIALAAPRLLTTLVRRVRAWWRGGRADRLSMEDEVYDFGARDEVRQMASLTTPMTYLQRLDSTKYAKLVQRRINDAVVDYLRRNGVDTSEYEERVSSYTNNGVVIAGDNYGAAAAGEKAKATTGGGDGKAR